jgi:GntR family transcriptional repressor for pyruvate dehydrogenase complex
MQGELKPGDRLPTERQFARELCISRASLREGIVHLNTFGVIKSVHGVGTFVAADRRYRPLEALGEFYNFPVWQVFETRLALEPHIAALAAERATTKQIADLGEEVAVISRLEGTSEQHRIHDIRFHKLLALACGNPLLSALMDAVTASTISDDAKSPDFAEETKMHLEIYRAIRSREPRRARLVMEQHLQLSRAVRTTESSDVVAELILSAQTHSRTVVASAV